jgi:hypothetical protein
MPFAYLKEKLSFFFAFDDMKEELTVFVSVSRMLLGLPLASQSKPRPLVHISVHNLRASQDAPPPVTDSGSSSSDEDMQGKDNKKYLTSSSSESEEQVRQYLRSASHENIQQSTDLVHNRSSSQPPCHCGLF